MIKVEQARLIDHDLSSAYLFPLMRAEVYMEYVPLPRGELAAQWKPEFEPLRASTLTNLLDLPVFGTTGEAGRCTRFLISRVHGNSLWLEREYPIHVDDIHQLTGLSMEGEDVTKAFQGAGKHGKNKGKPTIYKRYGTTRDGHDVQPSSYTAPCQIDHT